MFWFDWAGPAGARVHLEPAAPSLKIEVIPICGAILAKEVARAPPNALTIEVETSNEFAFPGLWKDFDIRLQAIVC